MTEDTMSNTRSAGIAHMNDQLKRLIPTTFFADLPPLDRVAVLVKGWQRAVRVNQRLEAEMLKKDIALCKLQEWDMLTLDGEGHGVATTDAPWARALIDHALERTQP